VRSTGLRGGAGRLAVALAVTLLGTLLGAALLAGCRPAPPQQRPAPERPAGFNLGLAAVRDPSSRLGGTLRVVSGPLDSLDPTRSYQLGGWDLMRLYTRQLVSYPAQPGPAGAQPVPDLATGLGRSTDGGRTWRYTLRPGLRFENGRPITAADVKYGIERSFAASVLFGGPSWLVQLLDDPKLPYPGPYQDTTLYKHGLPAVLIRDPRTLVFRLNRPFADFDRVLALPAASPVPPALDTRENYGNRPVSSGPYRFAAAPTVGLHPTVLLVRNPFWDRRTDPVRQALPDRIELVTGLAPAERDLRLASGRADLDITGSGLQPEAAARILADPARASRVDNPTNGDLRLVAMPMSVAPMNNVHCRRAVQYAADKAAVKQALGGDYGAALATTLWPRDLPGYPASAAYPAGPDNHGALDRARSELRRCGHPGGFRTRIATVDSGRGLQVAKVVRDALARVGISAELRPFPEDIYLSAGAGSPKAVRDGRFGLTVVKWVADFPSPSAFYPPLLDGRNRRTLGNTDYARIADPRLQKACDVALATAQAATGRWRQVDGAAMQLAAYLPLAEDKAVLFTGPRVRNAFVHIAWRNYDVASIGVG
jgi:peptide/nickel transport system substrate-binding protein